MRACMKNQKYAKILISLSSYEPSLGPVSSVPYALRLDGVYIRPIKNVFHASYSPYSPYWALSTFHGLSPYNCMGNVWWELTFVCSCKKKKVSTEWKWGQKNVTSSVHIITGNSRGIWGLRRAKRLGGHRFVTLARLVSQSAIRFVTIGMLTIGPYAWWSLRY